MTWPGPETARESVICGGGVTVIGSKCAKTCMSAETVTVHEPGPLQSAPQPVNFEPAALVASSDTLAPSANCALQEPAVQSIPAGVETTRPCPSTTTVNACCAG